MEHPSLNMEYNFKHVLTTGIATQGLIMKHPGLLWNTL